MKKSPAIQLSIPQPCSQDWEEMQIQQGGRHCAHCQKVVTDFTGMTDAQLIDFFKKDDGAQCGRFRAEQLERTIRIIETPKSNIWARVAASLLLAFGLVKSTEAQTRKDSTENVVPKFSDKTAPEFSTQDKISGTLIDEKGEPVINANVEIMQDGKIVGRAFTDFDGRFEIVHLSNSKSFCTVRFSYIGVESIYSDIRPGKNITVNGKLYLVGRILTGAVSIFRDKEPVMNPPGRRTFRSSQIERTP